MSGPRRSSGDDNIFSKLERDSSRSATARLLNSTHLAWYGAGAAAVGVLIGALVWLAHDNATTVRVLPGAGVINAQQDSGPASASAGGEMTRPEPEPSEQIVLVNQPPQAAAAIRDERPEPVVARVDLGAAPAQAAPPMPMPRAAPAPHAAYVAPHTSVTSHTTAMSPRSVAAARPVHIAKTVVYAPRPAARSAVPHSRKPVGTASQKADQDPADNDVALISAIIMHDSSHAAERAQQVAPPCPRGKKCPALGLEQP